MTTYIAQNATTLLTGATDLDGDIIHVRRINGTVITTWPHILNLPNGTATIYRGGTVTYDDAGNTSAHPGASQSSSNGTFTFTLWDGTDESPTYTASLQLTGAATDTTAPVLSNPGASASGSNGALVGITTDEANGSTLYAVLTTSTTAPDAAQIQAGEDHTGTPTFALSQIVHATGAKTFTFSGLTPSTTYYPYLMQVDGSGNLSNIVNAVSVTTSSASQSTSAYVFGDRTPAGQAGIPASSFTPDASGHLQFSGGAINVTSAGANAGLNQSPYAVTIDGNQTTIDIISNAVSVSSSNEANAAIQSLNAISSNTDWTILMRNGTVWPRNGSNHKLMGAGTYANGTYSDPNCSGFVTTTTPETYIKSAIGTVTGGSFTLRPDTPGGAVIREFLQFVSSSSWILDGIVIENVTSVPGRQLIDGGPSATFSGGPGPNNDSENKREIIVAGNNEASQPTNAFIMRNCELGGAAHGTHITHWGSYIDTKGIGHMVLEDNKMNGTFIVCQFGSVRRAVARRNESRQRVLDLFRCFGTKAAIVGAGNRIQCEVVSNTAWNVAPDAWHFSGAHADFWQGGTKVDQVNLHYCFTDNVHVLEGDRNEGTAQLQIHAYYDGSNGRPDFRGITFTNESNFKTGAKQGVFANHLSSPANSITGKIYKDVYMGNAFNSVTLSQADAFSVEECLLIQAPNQTDNDNTNAWKLRLDAGPASPLDIKNNIYTSIKTNSHPNYTYTGNVQLNHKSSGVDGFAANFYGPFQSDIGNGVRATLDESSAAALRASMAAVFTPKPGSMAFGKGPYG